MTDAEFVELADELALYAGDPVKFVEEMFNWDSPELKGKHPEPWQREVLEAIRDGLPLGKAVRLAVASGHGVGKTCLVSWILLWAMSTREDTRGILTASNEAQLATRNRAELRKWFDLWRAREFFELTATALLHADSQSQQVWRIDLLPWNEHRPEAFAGLHNQGKRVVVIMDEASVIPPIIWQTIEPVMTDVDTEIIWCVFGNPLHPTGPFRECFGRFAHRWRRWHIDARTVGISDKKQIAEWAEDHEEDSYFFMTRVRGEFPSAGALQFIDTDLVEQAMTREPQPLPNDALIVGVDVARFGDDASVIYARRGMDARSIPPIVVRKTGADRVEDMVLQFCTQHQPDVIFIDGSGVGGAVVDHLANRHNLPVEDIQFGSKALNVTDQVRYAQRRSEMWGNMKDALKYLAIPNSSELRDQLIGPQYDFNLRGELQLEKKADMKRRGLASPDIADALALTFARPVFPKQFETWANNGRVVSDYSPIEEFEREQDGRPRTPPRYIAPGYARLRPEFE
jgi:hypothetical protein